MSMLLHILAIGPDYCAVAAQAPADCWCGETRIILGGDSGCSGGSDTDSDNSDSHMTVIKE